MSCEEPVIAGGGLTLRPWRTEDVAFVFDAAQDPEVARWTELPVPYTAGHAVVFVRWAAARIAAGEAWHLAITSTDTGELLGSVGAKEVRDRRVELGYWLAPEARGRGVASRALDLLAVWCFDTMDVTEAWCRIARGNAASQRVGERAGFVAAGVEPGGCHDGDRPDDALIYVRAR